MSLDFFREALVTKEVFKSTKRCRSRFDALIVDSVRGERSIGDRAQIFEALADSYKPRAVDEKARRVRSRGRLTWRREVYRLCSPIAKLPLVLQGVFFPNKISGVGTNFGLLVHVLPGPNKQRAFEPSALLS